MNLPAFLDVRRLLPPDPPEVALRKLCFPWLSPVPPTKEQVKKAEAKRKLENIRARAALRKHNPAGTKLLRKYLRRLGVSTKGMTAKDIWGYA